MSERTLGARAGRRHDTEANWLQVTNYVPKAGELIVYDTDATHDAPRFKVGDGVTNVNALPFAAAHSIGSVRIDQTINPADWTAQSGGKWIVNINNDKITSGMDILEFTLDDASVRLGTCEIETFSGFVRLTVSQQQVDPWVIHLSLATVYTPEVVDYPEIAMTRIRVQLATTAWTDNGDGTVSATVTDANIFSQMSLIEWEPDEGKDFPLLLGYETFDGYVVFTSDEDIATAVAGYLTLGVDSASIGAGEIQGNVVTSVNGQTGDVTIPIAVETMSIGDMTILPAGWTAGTWSSSVAPAYETSGGTCYYYEATCLGTATGDRFVCTLTKGNPSPLYVTPLNDEL